MYQRQFAAIVATTSGVRRPGAAALDLASVASGSFDGFWELTLAPWDVAAGVLLVREAGGIVTEPRGHARHWSRSRRSGSSEPRHARVAAEHARDGVRSR